MVKYTIGRLLQVEAILLVAPLAVSIIYQEEWKYSFSFLSISLLLLTIGYLLSNKKPIKKNMFAKEGFIIVSLSWILLSFFGSLPFVINGDIPRLIDAFFETSSGFTTTGSSILTDVEVLAQSSLFWRSFTHLIGGMGILVFALAILPQIESESVHIMKAEVPGPVFGKLVSKLSSSARILYKIYLILTAVVVILLLFGGMNLFDALLHAFGAAGTGGFGIKNGSIAPYDSAYIDYVLSFSMLVFGVNFNLFYLVLIGQMKVVFKSEELRWYIGMVLAAVTLICLNLFSHYDSFWRMLRDVFFSVSSIITTTGFSTADFGSWPVFSQTVLLILMFFGASAGSTAGGLKISRVAILWKTAVSEFKRNANPNRIVTIKYEGKPLDKEVKHSVTNYFVIYMIIFFALLLLISFDAPDFTSAFSAVAATFNNIGPGLGTVGPLASYAHVSDFSKLILSFAMIAGRLEIFPILILFNRNTWRKHI